MASKSTLKWTLTVSSSNRLLVIGTLYLLLISSFHQCVLVVMKNCLRWTGQVLLQAANAQDGQYILILKVIGVQLIRLKMDVSISGLLNQPRCQRLENSKFVEKEEVSHSFQLPVHLKAKSVHKMHQFYVIQMQLLWITWSVLKINHRARLMVSKSFHHLIKMAVGKLWRLWWKTTCPWQHWKCNSINHACARMKSTQITSKTMTTTCLSIHLVKAALMISKLEAKQIQDT